MENYSHIDVNNAFPEIKRIFLRELAQNCFLIIFSLRFIKKKGNCAIFQSKQNYIIC